MATTKKLTKSRVEGARPRRARYDLTCETLPGFGVRVYPTGRRTYFVYYRLADRTPRRLTLGPHGTLTCEQARGMARDVLLRVRRGEDPSGARKAARNAPRVEDLCDRYIAERIPDMKPSTRRSERALIETHVRKRLGRRTVASLRRADMEALRSAMRKSPGAYNKVLGLLSRMLKAAETWGMREPGSNPCKGVRKNRERKVERFLSAHERAELERVLAATAGRPQRTRGAANGSALLAIRLLLATGCRRGEILDLRWGEVEWEHGALKLPDSKTGAKTVMLSPQALELLREKYYGQADGQRVCPGADGKRLTNLNRIWGRIRTEAGIEDVRLHDLRHSFASDAIAAGVPLQMVGKLLGHRSVASTARYAHLADDVLREAAARTGAAIQQRTSEGDNVIPMMGGSRGR